MKKQRIHIIGIAGMGMTALATYLKAQGHHITGSDAGSYDPSATYLKNAGIDFYTIYSASNIPDNAEIIVIGKHAKLTMDNEEIAAAFEHSGEVISMAEMWGRLAQDTDNTLVVGSYGKSTCTSLLSWCLIEGGRDPHYFIGAVPHGLSLSHVGSENMFIMEGDEYPTTNFDMTSKFMYLNGKHVLLTSGEHDHVNMFPTVEGYLKTYRGLLQTLTKESILIASIDHPNVPELVKDTPAKLTTYSMRKHDGYHPRNIVYGKVSTADLYKGDEFIMSFSTTLLGSFNIENIVGVSAMILEQELLTPDQLARGIETFKGVVRRLDRKDSGSTVPVYEGFGSSYTKARTALEALLLHFPKKRIITVFEPHTFSWRDPSTAHWYDDVFEGSDIVLVYQPPAKDGKNVKGQLSLSEIVEKITHGATVAHGITNADEGLNLLQECTQSDDIILILSSGEVGGLVTKIPHWAEREFPEES